MKSKILTINILLLCLSMLLPAKLLAGNYCFIENKGQWNSDVKYLFKGKNYRAWITNSGVVYDYFEAKQNIIKGDVIKIAFQNAKPNPSFNAKRKLQTKHNYFIGNNPDKWATNVELYQEIYLENIYDGINIKYYVDTVNGKNLRYDFEVLPFANPNLIQLQVEGPDSININKNNELELCLNDKIYKHTNLLAYQTNQIECKFSKNQHIAKSYGFEVGHYDITQKLIIDPLIYSILIGGEEEERIYAVATDISGAAYWTGFTYSFRYHTVTGSYEVSKIPSPTISKDAVISKIDSLGKKPVFSTYLGGGGDDIGHYIKVDELNQVYIVGETNSIPTSGSSIIPFPVKAPAGATTELTTYKNGNSAFLTKLSSDGKILDMSLLIGANNDDYPGGLSLIMEHDTLTKKDTLRSIAVATQLRGDRMPIILPYISSEAAQKNFGGIADCYITIIDKTGTNIEYATLWGGSGEETPKSIAVDKNKNVYIAAHTTSNDITTINPIADNNRGYEDIIVAKFDSTLSKVLYSTYIGGTLKDELGGMDVDTAGCAYITGSTFSADFPITKHLSNNQLKADTANVFITKLDSAGGSIVYSASIASMNSNYSAGIVVDNECNAHIAGHTSSIDFPISWDAFFEGHPNYGDAFYSVLNPAGDSLIFSSYIGGAQYEYAYGLALDNISAAYICGATLSGIQFPHSFIMADSTASGPILDKYEGFIFKSMYKPYPGELETDIELRGNMFCPGQTLSQLALYAEHGFYYTDNEFIIQLSDVNGNFTPNSTEIGRTQAFRTCLIDITFPSTLPASKNYRIRAVSTHPRSIGAPNSMPLDISPPYIELDSALLSGVCIADSLEIHIISNKCFNANNTYKLELSDENGSFGAPITLATRSGTGSMTFKIKMPENVAPNTAYKMRCISSSPSVYSNTADFNIIEPVVTLENATINSLQNKCAGDEFAFAFSATRCFEASNVFYLVLSDTAGNFTNVADTIGKTTLGDISDITDIDVPLSMFVQIPANLPFSKNYKIKLISTSPQQEYVLGNNNVAINFALGLPFIFADNLRDLQICYNDSATINLDIHNCFEEDNVFQAFVQATNGWELVGTSEPKSQELKVLIPSNKSITPNTFIFIKSTNLVVYSDTIPLSISSKEVAITGHSPAELCASDSFALNCFANFCVRDSITMFVEMAVNDSNFTTVTQIGTGKIFGNNSVISCQLPANINYNAKHYVRLSDGENFHSKHFLLGINPQALGITTEPADIEILCSGITFYIDFTATGCFDIENVFSIVLSDVTGSFETAEAQIVGSITSGNSGRIQVHIPFDIPEGNNYKIKIVSSHPQVESILDLDITIKNPFILIDSFSNLVQCDPNPVLPKQAVNTQADGTPYIKFTASDCFGEGNIFILQFGKDGDFSAPINVDSCAWNEREFNFTLPPNMGTDAYRFRIIATNPNISSDENGFDVKYNQPYATLIGINNPMICRGKNFIFSYITSECFEDNNTFYLEMSNEQGNFDVPLILDSNVNLLAGRFTIKVPETVPYNTSYKLRIRSTAPAGNFVQNQIVFTVRGPEILTGNLARIHTKRNDTLYVPFNCNCFDMEGKVFVAQLSDLYGKFDNILEIGNKIGWEPNGKIYTRISLDASNGNGYRIRVVCKNPEVVGTNNGKDITIFGIIVPEDIHEKETEIAPEVRPLPFYDELIVVPPSNEQLSQQSIKSLAIFDLLGRQQLKIEANNLQDNGNTIKINTNDLEIGTYILFIETQQKTYQKLIIKSYSTANF